MILFDCDFCYTKLLLTMNHCLVRLGFDFPSGGLKDIVLGGVLGKMPLTWKLVSLSEGSIIVWRLGGFGLILDAEFGFRKIISAVYGFCIVMRLQKIGI